MRLLADENLPLPSVAVLRQAGYDVAAVAETAPGITDSAILAWSRSEQRILVTFDRDFGKLVFRDLIPAHPGIIYFRFVPATPAEPGELLAALATARDMQFDGYFSTVERTQVRRRRLPEHPIKHVYERPSHAYAVAP